MHVRLPLLLLSLAPACTVGPDYEAPKVEAPSMWRNLPEDATASVEPHWWHAFGDPLLVELVALAERSNLDTRTAFERVQMARARWGVMNGERWPDIDASGSYRRVRTSQNGTNNRVAGFQFQDRDLWSAGLEATWEIDFWGRVTRAIEAAEAEVGASVEALRAAFVVVQAEVAATYVEIRVTQELLRIARDNVARQRTSQEIARSRSDAGLAPELDWLQAKTLVASTYAEQLGFEARLENLLNRLAVLCGQRPGSMHGRFAAGAAVPTLAGGLQIAIPANALTQRPDIRMAERSLAAATARVGVRTADLYPRVSLLGSFSFESVKADNLFESDSMAFSVGPALRWHVFDGGRTRSAIRVEEASTRVAREAFEQTVLRAIEEVESGLFAYGRESRREEALVAAVADAEAAARAAAKAYDAGLSDFIRNLDAQRSLAQLEESLARSRGQRALLAIAVYRALGGGWAIYERPLDDPALK